MRLIAAVCGAYLVARTWVVFRGVDPAGWSIVWPVIDVVLVTAILIGLGSAEDPTSLLYLLAVSYATLKLPIRQALLIVALAVLGQFTAGLVTGTWKPYVEAGNVMYILFRHFFLLLLASLIMFLSREAQRWRERLAVTEYQRDLSAEMHDGLQHDLVLIARRLDLAAAIAPSDPSRALDVAVEQGDVARRASDELRFLVRQLRPNAVTGADFLDGLRQHLAMLSERFDLPIELECHGDCRDIPPAYQHPMLRIMQEAITNAMKHAQPRHIRVSLRRGATRYKLRVEDDGEGFAMENRSEKPHGYGLETMAMRAEALGGQCRIVSRPGVGTRVIIRLPLCPTERRSWFRGSHTRTGG
jgi:signal transduction histidine kinase